MSMTSSENVRRLYRKQTAERVGLHEGIWGDTMRRWVTQGYPTEKVKKKVKEKALQDGKEVEVEKEVEKD